jgi:DNA-binding NtrC family response regulator
MINKNNVSGPSRRRFKMDNPHIANKRKPSDRTLVNEINRILLINPDKSSAVSKALAEQGYDVVHCASVQKAWNLVYPQRPDLIFLRLHNPDRAALSDLQECHALARGVPVILAISAPLNPSLAKTLQHEAAGVFLVSSNPEILRESLHDLAVSPIWSGNALGATH